MPAHSHGRRGAEFACPHVERAVAKARMRLSGTLLEAYLQGVERIDELSPHHSSGTNVAHGIAALEDLEEIETIERVLNEHLPEDMQMKYGVLCRWMIAAWQAEHA